MKSQGLLQQPLVSLLLILTLSTSDNAFSLPQPVVAALFKTSFYLPMLLG